MNRVGIDNDEVALNILFEYAYVSKAKMFYK